MTNIMHMINKATAVLRQRVMLMVARGVVQLINDKSGIQNIQVTLLADEIRDNVERFQNYGFSSVPLSGAEAAVVFVGGNRSHGLAIAIDDRRYRLKNLAAGEVAIYTDEGDSITLKRGKIINVNTETLNITASNSVNFTTPSINTTGLIKADGDITDNSSSNTNSMSTMRDIYNTHTHPENNLTSGSTDVPNEVMS
ncbi:MAG: phage baseplate assembly protein V [Alphaproteobacteria bacterium]